MRTVLALVKSRRYTPIGQMVDDMVKNGVHVFEHRNHDLDHVGPLHVSGHASQDESQLACSLFDRFFQLSVVQHELTAR